MLHYASTITPPIEELWFIMEVKTQHRGVEDKKIVAFGANEEVIRTRCLRWNTSKDDDIHYEVIQGEYKPL